jgi:hypothetical protein
MLVPETQSGIDLSDKEGYFTNLEIYWYQVLWLSNSEPGSSTDCSTV